ncbi:MAG TPA: TonB-dependent receptor [Sphingomicrobium sp.]|nr:TonB-dependent receptor [Sphingomicrobium sp.]
MTIFARSLYATTTSHVAMGVALAVIGASPAFAQDIAAEASAAAAVTAAQDPAAEAQPTTDATEADGKDIVVTGFRASIYSSVNQKRTSTSIVEVLSAEDIGKLPDASIAESLSRLPGLATQRFDGRASKLSVRGLAPDFTTTTLNGREMVSSDNNRSVEFDQFPSELINGAVVYKTPNAELTSQAIGGTVDLLTIRPLAHGKRTFVVGVRGEINDKGKLNKDTKDKGYRVNLAYIDQNADGTLGWAIGYSRMLQPIQEQYVHVWGYSDIDPDPNSEQFFIDGIKPYVKSYELTRDGLLGVIEYQPNDNWHTRVDAFWSKFRDDQTLRGQEIAGYTADSRDVLETDSNGLVTSGRWNGIHTMARNDFSDRDSKTFAVGLNQVWKFGDRWTLEFDASYSKAKRKFVATETYASTGRGQSGPDDDITYILGGSNGLDASGSGLDYSDPSLWGLGDNLGWGGPLCTEATGWQCASQDGYRNTETSSDDLTAFKLAAIREMDGGIKALRAGAKYSMREKDHTKFGEFLMLDGYPAIVPIPDEFLMDPTSLSFFGFGDTISYDARALVASGAYGFFPDHNNLEQAASDAWTVREKVFNAYVMADLDMQLGNIPMTGNIGVQFVHTDQESDGNVGDVTNGVITVTEVTRGDKYWDILPSMNLIFDVADGHKVRLGVARVLARARMDQMNAGVRFNYIPANAGQTDIANSPWQGDGGNPALRPWRAWQFDLSYEHYFGKGGYFAIAPFYKKLQNYIFSSQVLYDFTGVTPPVPPQPVLDQGFINSFDNGKGGKIYGLELSASVPFSTFADALDGFGFIGSASFTRSKVRRASDQPSEQLPGLSRNVFNGTVYYEKDGFGARLSARHRSSFLAESWAIGLSRELTMAKGETILDAQLSYELTKMGIPGLTLYLQGSNLTDEPFVQEFTTDRFRHWHSYGRNFMAGATYRF